MRSGCMASACVELRSALIQHETEVNRHGILESSTVKAQILLRDGIGFLTLVGLLRTREDKICKGPRELNKAAKVRVRGKRSETRAIHDSTFDRHHDDFTPQQVTGKFWKS